MHTCKPFRVFKRYTVPSILVDRYESFNFTVTWLITHKMFIQELKRKAKKELIDEQKGKEWKKISITTQWRNNKLIPFWMLVNCTTVTYIREWYGGYPLLWICPSAAIISIRNVMHASLYEQCMHDSVHFFKWVEKPVRSNFHISSRKKKKKISLYGTSDTVIIVWCHRTDEWISSFILRVVLQRTRTFE